MTYAFVGIPLAELLTLRETFMTCLTEIAIAGSSSSVGGRSFTHANLSEVKDTILEINAAIRLARGESNRRTIASFNNSSRY